MGRPKRDIRAAAEEAMTPPDQLTETQSLAKVIKAEGNSLYACSLPNRQTVLVELAARFRKTVWIRRGGYVLVQLTSSEEEKGRVEGDIINVVRDEKEWRKQSYWPKEFPRFTYDDEDEDSTTGKMPPSDSENED
ncbi:nucleic acid-binding protein [Annulohypoxylon moriforme]|nr:nucleic acid-binding protein [Annulohypoxylon moriforme]